MDRLYIVYFLVALTGMVLAVTYVYFIVQSRKRVRQRRRRDENQANRERLAARRIAENGGRALSERFATSDTARHESERSL